MTYVELYVELEEGVYLTDGDGDPPRTLVLEYALIFGDIRDAWKALLKAKTYRPFKDSLIRIRDI